MICGWAHPKADEILQRIDGMTLRARLTVRAAILAAVAVTGSLWCASPL